MADDVLGTRVDGRVYESVLIFGDTETSLSLPVKTPDAPSDSRHSEGTLMRKQARYITKGENLS